MATRTAKAEGGSEITVMEVQIGEFECYVLGNTPIILHRMSQKDRGKLLSPGPKANAAEKQARLKHDPLREFRDAAHVIKQEGAGTLLGMPASAFKGCLRSAATDLPGTKKAQIGRLTYVVGEMIEIYGVPQILCSVTRSSDIKKTPDIRTRPIIPRWAARLVVRYIKPQLREQGVVNLLVAAGMYIGVGDWRTEKGAGTYGQFRLCAPDDPLYLEIVRTGGREAQKEAMDDPTPYDADTGELLAWFDAEVKRRGFDPTKLGQSDEKALALAHRI
jgi:hypothetical protein